MINSSDLFGIPIPSTSRGFLVVVSLHVLVGLACVITGAVAMLSPKRKGPHPTFGTIYYWCLAAVFVSATGLAVFRWPEDYHLFFLGMLSFAAATFGRAAMRHRWPRWLRFHISGMGVSYIVLLTAFYVDNGKDLPIWRDIPSIVYWISPTAIGLPILLWALFRHSLVRVSRKSA